MYKLIALTLALGLTACASAQDRRAETSARHDRYCQSIGSRPGTQSYVDCRLRITQIEVQALSAADQSEAIRNTASASGPIFSAPAPAPAFHPAPVTFGR